MSVLLRAENSQDIIVFVNRLSKVTSLLLIPPLGIGVAELAFDSGRVGVVSVLQRNRGSANFTRLVQYVKSYQVRVLLLYRSSKSACFRESSAGDGEARGSCGLRQAPRQ